MSKSEKPEGLDLLRQPFPEHHISKLPKPTKAQTDAVRADFKAGIRCDVCGGWHHPKVVHLDYVGHAALTDRLLDCDPAWTWEPFAIAPDGRPLLDQNGGLWIRLTVCGVTRIGYGDADGKSGGNAVKEAIGDALRNAAMRFGAALDLWHKGDLHTEETDAYTQPRGEVSPIDAKGKTNREIKAEYNRIKAPLDQCNTLEDLKDWQEMFGEALAELPEDYKDSLRGEYTRKREEIKAKEPA